jgi:glycolate oxidase FAD binding subunit
MTDPLVEQVRNACADATPLLIRGGGTKDFYGQANEGSLLDTRGLTGIIAYTPSELVLTARAGTPLSEVDTLLAKHGQFLPFEPPQYDTGATLGGAIASGLSGPGRLAAGAVRDFVLGALILDGRAQVLQFGGRVMKNVAGYDLARAFVGSLGTLGVILEVSLKVLPRPIAQASVRLTMSASEALARMASFATDPVPITATAFCGGQLWVRLGASAGSVEKAVSALGGESVPTPQADSFWCDLRDQRMPFFRQEGPLWRIALPANSPELSLPGEQCFEWAGTLRWLHSDAPGALVREAAAALGGHATLFRASEDDKKKMGVFTRRSTAVSAIERRLREAFDPKALFNRGRIDAA